MLAHFIGKVGTAIVLNFNGTMNAWYRASESVDCACQEVSFFGRLVEIMILLPMLQCGL